MNIPRAFALPLFAIPWMCAVGVFGWVLVHRFPPNGTFIATTNFDGVQAFINPFLPSERTTPPGQQPDGWKGQRVTGDPVYFTARVPGPYDQAEVEFEFRPTHQPLVEFGVIRDTEGKDIEMRPLYAAELASPEWVATPGGYLHREGGFTSVSVLPIERVMTWGATTSMPIWQDPPSEPRTIPTSLRGSHDIYLVPAGGVIDLTFGLQDAKRKPGRTTAVFRVLRDDVEFRNDVVATSGSQDTKMSQVFEHRVVVRDATPGVYRFAIQADDDVFIRSVKTNVRHWVIGPRLVFGDVVGYSTTTFSGRAWTTSRHLVAETFHREGLQTASLGSRQVKIVRTHTPFRLDRTDAQTTPVEFLAPQGDVRLVGDGWFALEPSAFFEPKPKRLTDGASLSLEGIRGVVTSYQRPDALEDGWLRAHQSITLNPSRDVLRFVLSSPGIASRLGSVDIRKITIRYQRPPMTFREWLQVMRQELVNAWHRL